jgi:hypothetical protein
MPIDLHLDSAGNLYISSLFWGPSGNNPHARGFIYKFDGDSLQIVVGGLLCDDPAGYTGNWNSGNPPSAYCANYASYDDYQLNAALKEAWQMSAINLDYPINRPGFYAGLKIDDYNELLLYPEMSTSSYYTKLAGYNLLDGSSAAAGYYMYGSYGETSYTYTSIGEIAVNNSAGQPVIWFPPISSHGSLACSNWYGEGMFDGFFSLCASDTVTDQMTFNINTGGGDYCGFDSISGISPRNADNLYIVDSSQSAVWRFEGTNTCPPAQITAHYVAGQLPSGSARKSSTGGYAGDLGDPKKALFNHPSDIAYIPATSNHQPLLCIADSGNHRVRCIINPN